MGYPCLAQTQTYRFEDEKGNVYLVDSMKKVPERYRVSVDRLPESADMAVIGNALQVPMASGDATAVRKILFSYVYKDVVPIVFALSSILFAILILFARSRINRLTLYLLLVTAILTVHTIVVVPRIQQKVFVFGNAAISMTPASHRKRILPYRMALDAYVTQPASMKAWDVHLKLRGLAADTVKLAGP